MIAPLSTPLSRLPATHMLPYAEIQRLLHNPQCARTQPQPAPRRAPSTPHLALLPQSEVRRLLHGDQHLAKRRRGTGSVCAALATEPSAGNTVTSSPLFGGKRVCPPRHASAHPALGLGDQLLPPGAVYSMLHSGLSASGVLHATPARHHQGPLPPRGSWSQSAADTLFATLMANVSPLALRPRDPAQMHAQCEAWMDCLQHQYAPSTNLADRSHMKKWTAHCADLGTPPLRSDIAANIGVDLAAVFSIAVTGHGYAV